MYITQMSWIKFQHNVKSLKKTSVILQVGCFVYGKYVLRSTLGPDFR